jgi:long-chain acyl-CoA synthetase
VRRVFVEERYNDVIAALYGDQPEVAIDTTIKFQDGKVSRIRTTLLVRRLALGKAA